MRSYHQLIEKHGESLRAAGYMVPDDIGRQIYWAVNALRGSVTCLGCIMDYFHADGGDPGYLHQMLVMFATNKVHLHNDRPNGYLSIGEQLKEMFTYYCSWDDDDESFTDSKVWFMACLLSKKLDQCHVRAPNDPLNTDVEKLSPGGAHVQIAGL